MIGSYYVFLFVWAKWPWETIHEKMLLYAKIENFL